LKHEKFTASTHVIYSYVFVIIAQKHLLPSTIWFLQKFRLVRMVGYHYMFLISKYFQLYPKLNEVVLISPNFDLGCWN